MDDPENDLPPIPEWPAAAAMIGATFDLLHKKIFDLEQRVAKLELRDR